MMSTRRTKKGKLSNNETGMQINVVESSSISGTSIPEWQLLSPVERPSSAALKKNCELSLRGKKEGKRTKKQYLWRESIQFT